MVSPFNIVPCSLHPGIWPWWLMRRIGGHGCYRPSQSNPSNIPEQCAWGKDKIFLQVRIFRWLFIDSTCKWQFPAQSWQFGPQSDPRGRGPPQTRGGDCPWRWGATWGCSRWCRWSTPYHRSNCCIKKLEAILNELFLINTYLASSWLFWLNSVVVEVDPVTWAPLALRNFLKETEALVRLSDSEWRET